MIKAVIEKKKKSLILFPSQKSMRPLTSFETSHRVFTFAAREKRLAICGFGESEREKRERERGRKERRVEASKDFRVF